MYRDLTPYPESVNSRTSFISHMSRFQTIYVFRTQCDRESNSDGSVVVVAVVVVLVVVVVVASAAVVVVVAVAVSVVVVVVEVDSWMDSESDSSFTATEIVDVTTHIIRTMRGWCIAE